MYEFLDEFTREILFYFADDLGTGVGWGIIILTCLSRIPFAINQMKILASSMKFEAKTEEVNAIQEKMKMASRSRDMEMHKILMQRMNNLRRMSGLRTSRMMVSMLQIPLAITLFMSLRHVLVLPEVFPGIKTQGFLWFKDLTVLDPYFILPIISAFLSYWSISLSTMRAPGQAMQSFYVTVLRQYAR
jgi:YidC/Oxa1 family membrane protein insertase